MSTTPVIEVIRHLVSQAVETARKNGTLRLETVPEVQIEHPGNPEHGDFATNLPLRLARATRINPMELAQSLVKVIPESEPVGSIEAAPPGFINFRLKDAWLQQQVDRVREAGATFGNVSYGNDRRVMIEFVSVNPTGPVHVGHTRGAVLGSALANVMEAAGYRVTREYYVNDGGSQMEAFYRSVLARYRQAFGHDAEMPSNGYMGDYIADLAGEIIEAEGDRFIDEPEEQAVRGIGDLGREKMVGLIREDLGKIGVEFDNWFSERTLYDNGEYNEALGQLREGGYLSQREDALWFNSTMLGDEKDNVVVRSSGEPTYFASDIAYHHNKFTGRGFDSVVNIWGADHQGHVTRLKAALEGLGIDPAKLTILIAQMVTLKRGSEVVRASKRAGEFVTLRELADEVGKRRLPVLLPLQNSVNADGVRPGIGEEGIFGEPGLLRPVRPRPQRRHSQTGPRPEHRLEQGGRFPAERSERAGPGSRHAAPAGAGAADGRVLGAAPPGPLHHGTCHGVSWVLRKLPGHLRQPGRRRRYPGASEAGGIRPDSIPPLPGLDGHGRAGTNVAFPQQASPTMRRNPGY